MCSRKLNSSDGEWCRGKVALVTGATSGIGREISKLLAASGAKVLLCGRNEQAMASVSAEMAAGGAPAIETFICDFSDSASVEKLADNIGSRYSVDILVNNAGFGHIGTFDETPEDTIISMQEVNISAVVTLTRKFLPFMLEKSGGGILNVGSIASFFSIPGSALYCATKHFIIAFTDALHEEAARFGVHVTGVYPGNTATGFAARATGGKIKAWESAMDPAVVAREALHGLRDNKIRVIPGYTNKIKVLAAALMPLRLRLKKLYAGFVEMKK